MVNGLIDLVEVEGRKVLVQTEDRGLQREEIVTSAFEGGALVYARTVSYSDLVGLGLSDQEAVLSKALRQLHMHALRSVGGKLHQEQVKRK